MTACLLSSSLTMVMAVFAAQRHEHIMDAQLAAGHDGVRHGVHRAARHGVDEVDPRRTIVAGISPKPSGQVDGEFAKISQGVPQFAATFFGLTAMHMLHVTIGVIYLGVVALRKWFLLILSKVRLVGCFLQFRRTTFFITASMRC